MNKLLIVLAVALLMASCHRAPQDIEPKINYVVQDKYLRQLPSPFPPLSESEKMQDFGKEYLIGLAFARQLDLYQAITAFKRAAILIPLSLTERKREIEYEILLCYYMGKKYGDVIETFETSMLRETDNSFPAFHDLLVILYDAYTQTGQTTKAEQMKAMLYHYYPEEGQKLCLSTDLLHANLPALQKAAQEPPFQSYLLPFLTAYEQGKKSVSTAQTLNALLPGSGYLYLGQTQSAVTALLLNGLFIGASVHFFQKGNIAAGAIFTSFEAGWYFGGIYGGGLEAKYYNERLYERLATPMMNQQGLFPIFMLNHAF